MDLLDQNERELSLLQATQLTLSVGTLEMVQDFRQEAQKLHWHWHWEQWKIPLYITCLCDSKQTAKHKAYKLYSWFKFLSLCTGEI